MENSDIQLEGIDLLCGAGGATSGMEDARGPGGEKICNVIACINHSPVAIKTHQANHPHIQHFVEDIIGFDVKRFRVWSNGVFRFLFAGIECTNHSIAKGGLPRDADSRTLAEHLEPYIAYLNLDYIIIENVKEFRLWGPLVPKVKKTEEGYEYCPLYIQTNKKKHELKIGPWLIPHPTKKGLDYRKWIKMVESYGYHHQERILNAADYGARTIRKRLFIIFAKAGLPIEWAIPTHNKNGTDGLKKWNAVKPALDLKDEGFSIFNRKKALSEKTLYRIYHGALKHIAGTKDDVFLMKWFGNRMEDHMNNGKSIHDPCPTVVTQNRLGIAKCVKKDQHQTEMFNVPTDGEGEFIMAYHGNGDNTKNINEPAFSVLAADALAKVKADFFLDIQYSNGKLSQGLNEPIGSVVANPKQHLVHAQILQNQFNDKGTKVQDPAPTVMTSPQYLVSYFNTSRDNHSLEEPCPTVCANYRHHYLVNPQFESNGQGIDRPCFTIIARMDKKPPYLVSAETGKTTIVFYEDDSPATKKLKMFMVYFGIIDIKMRMLKVAELLKIQDFRTGYKMYGNQTEQKWQIGNAVVRVVAKKLVESLYMGLVQHLKKAA